MLDAVERHRDHKHFSVRLHGKRTDGRGQQRA
jgi:hypothetical protein